MPLGKEKPALPDGWVWCEIQDVGEAILGRQKNSRSTSSEEYPYLRVANVQDDQLDLSELTKMHFTEEERERYRLSPYDILLCEGQSPELVGRPAMYKGEIPELYFQNHLIRFRANSYVDPEFALLVFRAYLHDGTFQAIATSTTNLANLGLGRFKKLPFPLPPLKVQTSIGETARAAQESIDYLRQRLGGTRNLLETAISALRDVQILSATVDLSRPDLPRVPGGGRWMAAADVVAPKSPIVYGIVQPGPPQNPGEGVPYVRGQDIRDGDILVEELPWTTTDVAAKYARSEISAGDVLISIIRYMRAAVVPEELAGANISRGAARFRPAEGVDGNYLMHWLESWSAQTWLRNRLRGTGMPGLNLSDLRRLPIPLPSHDIQRKIAKRLDAQLAAAREISRRLDSCELLASFVERAILTSSVAGELAYAATRGQRRQSARDPGGAQILERLRSTVGSDSYRTNAESAMASSGSRKPRTRGSGTQRRLVEDVVRQVHEPLSPEDAFRQTGMSIEDVDEFFAELRDAVEANTIVVDRPDESQVFLRAAVTP